MRAREVAHTQISSSLLQHPNFTSSLMEITQSSIPNQANIFWRRTDSRLSLMLNYISGKPGSKPPGKFQFFGVEIFFSSFFRGGLMFYSPLVFFFFFFSPSSSQAEMMNIVLLIIKRRGRSPRDQGNGGRGGRGGGGVEQERTVREKCYVGQ